MTELTLQFIPLDSDIRSAIEVAASDDIRKISEKTGGLTSITLDKKKKIEFSKFGSIRYSEKVERLDQADLYRMFESAKAKIQNILNVDVSDHSVCILITGTNSVSLYLENEKKISEFGMSKFDCQDPKYTEINDTTIKLSFRKKAIA